jgi:hypothetical protein
MIVDLLFRQLSAMVARLPILAEGEEGEGEVVVVDRRWKVMVVEAVVHCLKARAAVEEDRCLTEVEEQVVVDCYLKVEVE